MFPAKFADPTYRHSHKVKALVSIGLFCVTAAMCFAPDRTLELAGANFLVNLLWVWGEE